MSTPQIYDSVIIGTGPAGVTAALYLARAGMNIAMIEKAALGGQVLLTAEIENYPGFPRPIKGWELADLLEAQIQPYMPRRIQTNVESIDFSKEEGGTHTINTARGPILAKTVIIASGAVHRHLGHPSEEAYQGKGVSYCAVCDGNFYKGLDVAVIGGGNSALEEALYLSRIVNHLYIIHRRKEFRGAKIYQDKLRKAENITILTPSVLEEIKGNPQVEEVVIKNLETNELQSINVAGVFVFVGTKPASEFLNSDLEMNESGFVLTDAEMHTNLPGIFAAGDIREKHCRQVTTAVGDGATAATAAISYLEQLNA